MKTESLSVITRTLDPLQRTQRLRSVGAGLTALDLTYGYNNNSQISAILDGSTAGIGAAGKTHSVSNLAYDSLGQMTTADGPAGSFSTSFDPQDRMIANATVLPPLIERSLT